MSDHHTHPLNPPPTAYGFGRGMKYGLVKSVADWPWSSFHRYLRMGYDEAGWGERIEELVDRIAGNRWQKMVRPL
jgi:hypothetical protein